MKRNGHEQRGFTLIELLLVVVIIGLMLAVIVPRAWRANIDAKYGLVRQNASELASFGNLWAEQQIEASNESRSTAHMYNYLRTLTFNNNGVTSGRPISWIATADLTHWPNSTTPFAINGRVQGQVVDAPPENTVEAIVPVERIPRNPFNGVSVFAASNDPVTTTTPVPGALACGWQVDDARGAGQQWAYFGFVFQGTDSTTITLDGATEPNTFLAGQDRNLAGLRNGIFFARVPYYDAPAVPALP